jgi:hypothetical protein
LTRQERRQDKMRNDGTGGGERRQEERRQDKAFYAGCGYL